MYYVEIARYRTPKRRPGQYAGRTFVEFDNLDEARKFAITIANRGEWSHTTAYVSQAFYPNRDVTSFIGGGVRGVNIMKNKSENPVGAVVPNRGKFYWVLNNPEHKKYTLNIYGKTIDLPSKDDWHPFGL